jgi:hypothetical protein
LTCRFLPADEKEESSERGLPELVSGKLPDDSYWGLEHFFRSEVVVLAASNVLGSGESFENGTISRNDPTDCGQQRGKRYGLELGILEAEPVTLEKQNGAEAWHTNPGKALNLRLNPRYTQG